jgi:hypothetical protein
MARCCNQLHWCVIRKFLVPRIRRMARTLFDPRLLILSNNNDNKLTVSTLHSIKPFCILRKNGFIIYKLQFRVLPRFRPSWAYREGRVGVAAPPSLLGKQSQSGNIRFTVGQYWLIIKLNGTNSVNFVGNSVNFVGNMLSNRNFSLSLQHPPPPPPPPPPRRQGPKTASYRRKPAAVSNPDLHWEAYELRNIVYAQRFSITEWLFLHRKLPRKLRYIRKSASHNHRNRQTI